MVHEEAALSLLPVLMEPPATAALSACIAFCSKLQKRKNEGTVASYREAVICRLQTFATDDVVAETFAEMICGTQTSYNSSTDYAEALCYKVL